MTSSNTPANGACNEDEVAKMVVGTRPALIPSMIVLWDSSIINCSSFRFDFLLYNTLQNLYIWFWSDVISLSEFAKADARENENEEVVEALSVWKNGRVDFIPMQMKSKNNMWPRKLFVKKHTSLCRSLSLPSTSCLCAQWRMAIFYAMWVVWPCWKR